MSAPTAPTCALIDKAAAKTPLARLAPLARSAHALGCAATQRKHLSVILRLSEYGFFRAGGVMVGTHAFLAYANQLGLRWVEPDQTADVDFAHARRNLSIALPASVRAEPHSALTTMAEGFLPLVQYKGTAGASYRHRDEPEFQVDFLTPRVADDDEPFHIDNLDVALQPLRFMEFSLEDVQQATLFDPAGRSVVVSLPAPERYAVHKLLVVGERTGRFKAKASKDLAQAAALLEYFLAIDADSIRSAWVDALARGPGWRKRAREGKKALKASAPELAKEPDGTALRAFFWRRHSQPTASSHCRRPRRATSRCCACSPARRSCSSTAWTAPNGRPRSRAHRPPCGRRPPRRRAAGRPRAVVRGDARARHARQRPHGRARREGHRARRERDPAAGLRALGAAPGGRARRRRAARTGKASRRRPANSADGHASPRCWRRSRWRRGSRPAPQPGPTGSCSASTPVRRRPKRLAAIARRPWRTRRRDPRSSC